MENFIWIIPSDGGAGVFINPASIVLAKFGEPGTMELHLTNGSVINVTGGGLIDLVNRLIRTSQNLSGSPIPESLKDSIAESIKTH